MTASRPPIEPRSVAGDLRSGAYKGKAAMIGTASMSSMLDECVIAEIAGWARAEALILEIRAFGSRVSGLSKDGTPTRPTSDLDLAVTLDLPASSTASDVQHVWTPLRQRGLSTLAPVIPWILDFW